MGKVTAKRSRHRVEATTGLPGGAVADAAASAPPEVVAAAHLTETHPLVKQVRPMTRSERMRGEFRACGAALACAPRVVKQRLRSVCARIHTCGVRAYRGRRSSILYAPSFAVPYTWDDGSLNAPSSSLGAD